MMLVRFLLLVLVAACPLHAQTETRSVPKVVRDSRPAPGIPAEARAGDALLVWIPRPEPSTGFFGDAILRSPEGTVVKTAAAFHVPGGEAAGWDACALGLPMDMPAGAYKVELAGARGGEAYSYVHALTVLSRSFISEDIPLTTGLTAIRTEESSRKTEEARVYAEVLGRVDPAGCWMNTPFRLPVASERRTSFFGDRRRYLYATGGASTSVHAGIDFAAATGTPVVAAGRGRVVLAADRVVTGKTVILEHLPGVYTIYMHLDTLAVAVGGVVERGDRIGTAGATGLATGPHLHWELRVCGEACDPESPAFWSSFPLGTNDPSRGTVPAAAP